jgi:hypothetical protein
VTGPETWRLLAQLERLRPRNVLVGASASMLAEAGTLPDERVAALVAMCVRLGGKVECTLPEPAPATAARPAPAPKPPVVKPDFQAAVAAAEARAPGNTFVASCRAFLAAKGFLSAKQLKDLAETKPPRVASFGPRRYHQALSGGYDGDGPDTDWGQHSWDLAGGE